MKLSIEQVQELAELQKKVADVYKELDYSSVGERCVQMSSRTFLDTFNTFAVGERECSEYPFELSTVFGGSRFITIMTTAKFAELENTHPEAFDYTSKAIQVETP